MSPASTTGAPADEARRPSPLAEAAAAWLPVALAAGLFAWFAALLPAVSGGAVLRPTLEWVPSLGIRASLLIDGLSLTFALLITGIGALVLLYSRTYLAGHPHYPRFALFLTAFMLSMLGLVLADDLVLLFVFWELTTITSYLLIGFDHAAAKSRRSALQALLLTGAGGLAFLAGVIIIGTATGTYSLAEILGAEVPLREHPWYLAILILVLAGAFTKSAQFPFHFWLPNAMAAPTPVSAYLHSATMVKAGVYLLARLHPTLGGTEVWFWTLTVAGGFTAVLASLLSVRQTDLKLSLAYTTVMALGTLTLLLGQQGAYAMTAFATFLVAHSLYKASLFLVVGCIDHETGTREAEILGGLARAMPVTALAAALAGLSMAGFPPLLGFIGKELAYAAAVEYSARPYLVGGALLGANVLMVVVAGIVALRPFWRPAPAPLPRTPHEAPWTMLAGPVLLALGGLAFGIFPGLLQGAVVNPTVLGFVGPDTTPAILRLWAGFNAAFVLSLVTFAVGIALYLVHVRLRGLIAAAEARLPDFDTGWDRLMEGLLRFAIWQAQAIQTGRLRTYIAATFGVVAAALAFALLMRGRWPEPAALGAVGWLQLAPVALILAGSAVAALTASRIAALAGLGATGIGVAIVFILWGAPDVAITQLLVETLTVVLMAVAMLRLPHLAADRRPGHGLLALATGTAVGGALLMVLGTPMDRRLSDFFEAASYPDAHGRNIVNVILVDFRALDTFGEIVVVAVAALSALALLRAARTSSGRRAP
ncbi:hydrogen gas-evolving membrane-bound hydrogenase subunit E [Rubellimicrobium sp. CFH 75288]|uniref:hydrogen gas-evolving membrane-bound hydrogenase subunit E n=1 Tax=Rubellimicrobium sp. CFH 75288 TaxID=2697034 RepID=UPI0014134C87|nr:hydrogen gas-evolving membrane-bound hydrogenase subunit E [Rubellimicrobium sp. CFH 75288]NAZ35275.1 DUF4040 domain-containing protein [Rubellimicrobium sp. CFH 75288]